MLKTLWKITSATFTAWWNDDVFRLAAAIAFYTIFSLAPTLLISVGIASLVFSEEHAKHQIIEEIEKLTGAEGGKVAEQVFNNMIDIRQSPKAILYGLLAVVIGSTAVFANLQAALNQIWHVQPKSDRSVLKDLLRVRLRSFCIVLAVGFLLLVSMVVSAVINGFQALLAERLEGVSWVWRLLNLSMSFAIITLLFAMIYKYLPDVKISWSDVMMGAVITSILFSIGKFLIGFYLGHVAFGSAYGAAGSFVVLLIWIYYSTLICFFGAEFTQVYASSIGVRIRPQDHAEKTQES
ncbi:MAG: YihY/virulence factor BrkB family protein [Desulfobacteraceae bacterium]|nr:MAG: YihY/virulence factor BrkB family protein [Desulfobacteraceae bacterium]